jgi:3-phenylpropionate/cinnamic acid dioxygenase small subunit
MVQHNQLGFRDCRSDRLADRHRRDRVALPMHDERRHGNLVGFAYARSAMSFADRQSSYRAIESLIAAYAELVDDGDFEGVGDLLGDATFAGAAGGSVTGRDAIEKMLRENVIVYDDGTPRTKHLITNLAIEVDEEIGTAIARSYFTALQALPDAGLRPIVSGRYYDRFERREGRWRFLERRVRTDLVGDTSRHLRRPAAD